MVEPINYVAALRRSWRLLGVLALLGAVVAVLLPVSHPVVVKDDPVRYRATTIVGAPPAKGIVDSSTVTTPQILFFGNTFEVRANAVKAAKTPNPGLELVASMTASNQAANGKTPAKATAVVKAKNSTGLVVLSASAATKVEAAALANAYAKALGDKLTAVAASAAVASSGAAGRGQGTTTATPAPTGYQVLFPSYASSAVKSVKTTSSLGSSHKVRALAGLVVGLLIGAVVVLVVELSNKRLRTASRAEAHFKFPVVAEVPEAWPPGGDGGGQRIVMVTEPTSRGAESYRKLRMSVMFEAMAPVGTRVGAFLDPYADDPEPLQIEPYAVPAAGSRAVILVVSPDKEESRPQVVANLGAAYAEAGQRVIVIGTGDLDSGVPGGTELTSAGPVGPDEVRSHLQPSSIANLSMLSLRPFVRNSAQLVSRAAPVLDAARQIADAVIVEAPPFLEFHHGEAIAHAVDVVLVIGECGTTTFDDADQTGQLLRRIGAPVLGVVFTEVPLPKSEKRRRGGPAPRKDPVTDVAPSDPTGSLSQFPVESQA